MDILLLSQIQLFIAPLFGEAEIEDRFKQFLEQLKLFVGFDAASLMVREGDSLEIIASLGLSPEAQMKKYDLKDHPRLKIMMEVGHSVVFPPDSTLPDPFDGLLLHDHHALHQMHSCLGCPLIVEKELLGCLTLDAMKPGSFDSIPAEFLNMVSALGGAALKSALILEKFERESARQMEWQKELERIQVKREFIGDSEPIRKLQQEIKLVAPSPFPVLILGETGTGKELVARMVYQESSRSDKPMVVVNCAALADHLVESELFGHVKGAFTGAERDRMGKFEMAHQGTLFLDEIGDLPYIQQSKILRVLQEGEIQRVGSDHHRKVDVRIIAATHRDLNEMVEKGEFRRDLLHRLHVFPLRVPPLRERPSDIDLLLAAFADETCRELGYSPVRFSEASFKELRSFRWEGNVRELQNRVRAIIITMKMQDKNAYLVEPQYFLNEGDLIPKAVNQSFEVFQNQIKESIHLQPNIDTNAGSISFQEGVDQYKKDLIQNTLNKANGNWSKAAEILKLDRANLHRTARRLGLK